MHIPLPPGTELRARYRIEALVGQGGMGAVYRAQDLRLAGRRCAVKEIVLIPPAGTDADVPQQTFAQFHQEASILARLDHPNLPKVSDVFSLPQREYLVMDFVAGSNLSELLAQSAEPSRHGFPEDRVLAWSHQILDALAYLHDQSPPILHRDIKPANLILTSQGVVKLVDFGLVKLMQPNDPQTITVVQGRGTLAYTPIEQYGGENDFTSEASDIYSLGATLYHLLAGHVPADARTRFLQSGHLDELRKPGRRISRQTEAAIFHALALHPEQRPPSVAAFRLELLGPRSSPGAVPHGWSAPAPSWREALIAHRLLLGLALLLTMLALGMSLLPDAGS